MDFRSALYLGRNHARHDLPDWLRLTTGKPAALEETALARRMALEVAALQGCEDAVLGVSTLHLYWDFFGLLARSPVQIWMDAGAYPVARWGVERAQGMGAAAGEFRHHEPEHLRRLLRLRTPGRRPVVVTDGLCPACGTLAPLNEYWRLVENCGGLLVVDDTQALGILGMRPGSWTPYGEGGGGSLRAAQLEGREGLVMISSLAKAFGTPLAALSGSAGMVEDFRSNSMTRVHSSPPCMASLSAAAASLAWNRESGDGARHRLAGLVGRFRQRMLEQFGTLPAGGSFPVQNLRHRNAPAIHAALQARGVEALLLQARDTHPGIRLSFIIRADHPVREIDAAVDTLASLKEVACPV